MPDALRENILQEGERAPNFTLQNQDREGWTLSEAVKKGEVVLCFFPFAFTGVCATEMNCVSDEIESWRAKGAEVVGISCDSFAALKAWSKQLGLGQTLLSDIHRDVCKKYGLYWPDLNVSKRGTVVIHQNDSGKATVKWSQAREPGTAMEWDEVLGQVG